MKTNDLAEALEKLQAQLSALSERIERLEVKEPKAPTIEAEPAKPEITEEELIAISAALGAYLGVRVRIKQIRLLGSPAWTQQGRVSIQASHKLYN
jgi:methylmalonyl-CoA carboxyltransferase 12S subunit